MTARRIILLFLITSALIGVGLSPINVLAEDSSGYAYEAEATLDLDGPAYTGPTGQKQRWRLANMRSVESTVNTATVISVTNLNTRTCKVSVDWFYGGQTTPTSYTSWKIPAGQQRNYCSRSVSSDVFESCNITCDPELTYHQGYAIVNSKDIDTCKYLAVSARIFYTSSDDSTVLGVSNPKIVKVTTGNKGD